MDGQCPTNPIPNHEAVPPTPDPQAPTRDAVAYYATHAHPAKQRNPKNHPGLHNGFRTNTPLYTTNHKGLLRLETTKSVVAHTPVENS